MVAPIGSLATRNCEPRQARKGATVAVDVCAEMWLVGAASINDACFYFVYPSDFALFSLIDSP